MSADLSHIRDWIFDLDDTLYPAEQGLMHLIQARINAFMIESTGLPADDARVLQKAFLDEHGTTLAGLMANYTVDPVHFLEVVHDVPLDEVEPNPALGRMLADLPGRCWVFTNGARSHAARVLARIDIADRFQGVFAIEDADLLPKPAPDTFRRMLATFDIDPRHAIFFEDTPRNLAPAHDLGMATVLVGDRATTPPEPWIDYQTPLLTDFLETLTLRDAA